jgi:glucose-6-phosphate 1-dehydrogenase
MAEVLMTRRINEMQPKPRPGDRCVLVIFGAAGDLTKRLLVPALCNLRGAGLLPEEFAVIGVSRRGMDNQTFRRDLGLGVRKSADEAADDWLAERIYHLQGELNDPAAYESSGPSEADALLMRDGRRWRPIDRTDAANSL